MKKTKSGKLTGSRYSDGNVPNINWNDGKLNVNWYNSDNANDNLRSRQAVSKKRGSALTEPLLKVSLS